MKRVILDIHKLKPEIGHLLTDKYPNGYRERDLIVFQNSKGQKVKALQLDTDEVVYLIKVEQNYMINFDKLDIGNEYLGGESDGDEEYSNSEMEYEDGDYD